MNKNLNSLSRRCLGLLPVMRCILGGRLRGMGVELTVMVMMMMIVVGVVGVVMTAI